MKEIGRIITGVIFDSIDDGRQHRCRERRTKRKIIEEDNTGDRVHRNANILKMRDTEAQITAKFSDRNEEDSKSRCSCDGKREPYQHSLRTIS